MTAKAADLDQYITDALAGEQLRRLGVAVSGGGDSMALMHLLCGWCEAHSVSLSAVTVDHGLRPESRDEAEMVARICHGLGVAHSTLRWEGWDGQGNLQAQARDARYSLIADWACDNGIDLVALGHTRDDQAETFLMGLARAAGPDGLSAMPQSFDRHEVRFIRPLLTASRSDLRDYLRDNNLSWIDDPSNEDVRFERVRMRKAMHAFEELGITSKALSRVVDSMQATSSLIKHYTVQEAKRVATQEQGDLLLRTTDSETHPEVMRRLTYLALQWVSGSAHPPRHSAMVHLAEALESSDRHTVGGCLVSKEAAGLRITRELNAVQDQTVPSHEIWDQRWVFDGPHQPRFVIRALGEAGLLQCPDWRETGSPRSSLIASPAIWAGNQLISAPLAGFDNGWSLHLVDGRDNFESFLESH